MSTQETDYGRGKSRPGVRGDNSPRFTGQQAVPVLAQRRYFPGSAGRPVPQPDRQGTESRGSGTGEEDSYGRQIVGQKSITGDDDPVLVVQDAWDSLTDEERDGIGVWVNRDVPHVVIIDVMDWGSEEVGKRIGAAAKKIVGEEHVIYHNEAGKPDGDSWVEIKSLVFDPEGLKSTKEEEKALSGLAEGSGGALVAPARQKFRIKIVGPSSLRRSRYAAKSLHFYTKAVEPPAPTPPPSQPTPEPESKPKPKQAAPKPVKQPAQPKPAQPQQAAPSPAPKPAPAPANEAPRSAQDNLRALRQQYGRNREQAAEEEVANNPNLVDIGELASEEEIPAEPEKQSDAEALREQYKEKLAEEKKPVRSRRKAPVMASNVTKAMPVYDPVANMARADMAEEQGDERGVRWWRGLAGVQQANPEVQAAFIECRTPSDMMRQHIGISRMSKQRFRGTLVETGWLTDGRFAVQVDEKERDKQLKGRVLGSVNTARAFDINTILSMYTPDVEVFPTNEVLVFGGDRGARWRGVVRFEGSKEGENYTPTVAAAYVSGLVRRYPNARWYISKSGEGHLMVVDNDKTVAIVMPTTL